MGPDNTTGTLPGNCDGWAVTVGAKNPDGALMYLIGTAEYYEENPVEDSIVQGFSEEQKAPYDEYVYGDATMRIESNRLEGIGKRQKPKADDILRRDENFNIIFHYIDEKDWILLST